MRIKQKGMGMTEVLVALVLLTIGAGSLVSLQLKSIDASADSLRRVEAMNIARDMVENIRTNPSQKDTYFSFSDTQNKFKTAGAGVDCYNKECTPVQKAKFDLTEMYNHAQRNGFVMQTANCPSNSGRKCIYVAWGSTSPTVGNNQNTNCVKATGGTSVYHENAKCVFLEAM